MELLATFFDHFRRPGLCCLLALGSYGCGGSARAEAPRRDYRVSVITESDPHQPLPGVQLVAAGKVAAVSSAAGVASLVLNGSEGTQIPVEVKCPAGFVSPSEPLTVVLRTLASGAVPELAASCLPSARSLVVVVKLDEAGALPIEEHGRTIGYTDANGVAHLVLRGASGDKRDLVINTSQRPELRPSNPSSVFVIGSRDGFVTYEKKFTIEKKSERRRAAKPEGPTRLK